MPSSTMQLISKTTLSTNQASVTFSGIPQTYTDLLITMSVRNTRTGFNADDVSLRFNGSSSSVYSSRAIEGSSTAALSYANTNQSLVLCAYSNSSITTSNTFANSEVFIPNYSGSSNKSLSSTSVVENNASGGGSAYIVCLSGLWASTAPITSIEVISPNSSFVTGSSFLLYGITSAAGSVPGTFGVDATGGDVTISGGYKYHVFRSSGVLTVAQPGWAEALVVAGGGSGGAQIGGGGGAGGLRYLSTYLTPGSYTTLIGAGGAALNSNVAGNVGSASSMGSILANGGGFGATYAQVTSSGGSGGGGGVGGPNAGGSGNIGGFTVPEGYAGGTAEDTGRRTGGGGGAGGPGVNGATNPRGGDGGPGFLFAGSFYAGGGGGGTDSVTAGGAYNGGNGGSSIGGNGGKGAVSGTAGAINTGSGGGGGGNVSGNPGGVGVGYGGGGAGGSGIVIVRYAVS